MEKILSASNLVLFWLLFTIISPLIYALIFCWGLRSGQFSKPDRSAFLPLEGFIPKEDGQPVDGADRQGRGENV